eukprot:2562789-Amphidinium_carterae.1
MHLQLMKFRECGFCAREGSTGKVVEDSPVIAATAVEESPATIDAAAAVEQSPVDVDTARAASGLGNHPMMYSKKCAQEAFYICVVDTTLGAGDDR